MTLDYIDEELDTAMNGARHPAYAAAARARWPMALLDLRELRDAGDALAQAAHDYMVAFVKLNSCDEEANVLALATEAYRKLRGIQ